MRHMSLCFNIIINLVKMCAFRNKKHTFTVFPNASLTKESLRSIGRKNVPFKMYMYFIILLQGRLASDICLR